ncbi:MAG: alpha/beta hydrolase [Verrucomicrobiota bacterium]
MKKTHLLRGITAIAVLVSSTCGTTFSFAQESDDERVLLQEQIAQFKSILDMESYTHCNENVLGPVADNKSRYPAATPPPCSVNRHGEIEYLQGVAMTHNFTEAGGMTFHYVTAGNPENPTILMIHGLPESCYGFHHQVAELSDEYYVIAIDMPGYGQSDKRLTLDHSFPGHARYTAALIDKLDEREFYLVTHDRGSALGDYLTAVPGMEERIIRWVRMEQTANEPHGEPRPPHALFGDPHYGPILFKSDGWVISSYDSSREIAAVARDLPQEVFDRIKFEWHFEGVAEAVNANFQTSNFDIELAERLGTDGSPGLITTMTMPILFLQGELDPGQHPEEYENTAEFFPNENNEVVILESAAHFTASEQPHIVSAYIRTFFKGERL